MEEDEMEEYKTWDEMDYYEQEEYLRYLSENMH